MISHQCDYIISTTDLLCEKFGMAISPQRYIIRSSSRLVLGRIFGVGDRAVLYPVRLNPRWRPAAILENFE